MKKDSIKSLSILLVLSIAFSFLPVSINAEDVYAAENISLDDKIEIEIESSGNEAEASVKKGKKSDKDTAQEAIEEFLENREANDSGEFAYDRYAEVNAEVKDVRVIKPEAGTSDYTATVSFDNAEQELADGYLKTEIITVDDKDGGKVLDQGEMNAPGEAEVSLDMDKNTQILAAAVLYSANEPDPVELRSQKLVRELMDTYAYPEAYATVASGQARKMTAAEKKEMDAVVKDAIGNSKTDYEKIRSVYTFVACNIFYDVVEKGQKNTYDVWKTKTGVCAGYAQLCEYLLDEAGVPCGYVVSSAPDENDPIGHAFNTAYDSQNKRWIYFDATWGASATYNKTENKWSTIYDTTDPNKSKYRKESSWFKVKRCSYEYFDMTPELAASITYHRIEDVYNDNIYTKLADGYAEYILHNQRGKGWFDPSKWKFSAEIIINTEADTIKVRGDLCGVPVTYSNLGEKPGKDYKFTKIVFPASVTNPGFSPVLSKMIDRPVTVQLLGNPPVRNSLTYLKNKNSIITYPCDNPAWTEEKANKLKSSCGINVCPAHELGPIVGQMDPVCEKKGYTDRRCNICGKTVREETAEKGEHVWEKGDLTDDLMIEYKCELCGMVKYETPESQGYEVISNPMRVTKKNKTIKYSAIKKTAKIFKAINVSRARGDVEFKIISGDRKNLKLKGNGKIKVRKSAKKGTYKLKVKVTASGDEIGKTYYMKESQIVTVKVRIK